MNYQGSDPITIRQNKVIKQPLSSSVKSWASSYSRSQQYNINQELNGLLQSEFDNEVENDHNALYTSSERSDVHNNERTPLISQPVIIEELEDAQDYKTLMHLGKSTFNQTVFNAVNILMGIAILSFPLAFKYAGWFFGISIFLFCLIQTNYTAKLLKKCLDTDPDCFTYADLASLAFGQKGKLIMGGLFMMDLFNAAVVIMILVGDSLKTLFPHVGLVQLKLISFFIITPITWMPIHFLSYASIFGIISTLSVAAVILIDGFTKLEPPGSILNPMDTSFFPSNWMTLPLAFGLINAGFAGHAVYPSLYRDMATPASYNRMVDYSYLISSLVYIIVAASGYLMFGPDTLQEITLNIMTTKGFSVLLNSIVVWMIVINPLSKFPLVVTPINLIFEIGFFKIPFVYQLFASKVAKSFYIIISRTILCSLVIFTAIFLPDFDRAMSLLGSLFSFLICGIFPILCHLKLFGNQLSNKELTWNLILLMLSSIFAITGTIWTFFPNEWLNDKN
ncbi:18938_t:CDS:2 [Funneliformis geosporum]|uniref:3836_t:CDS:1 n=1 Tax=Funneliformis geosporum TaxID=1117311 RepID=A0A9W4SK34_9GLOM|nr:18938_t:CDS:2 [Funneliformis geosporum]CAI2169849.1 3836_t:CDS:2 [Funneliformis geosporum]